MPTYDYKCLKCENVQEDFHWMNQNPEIKCDECGEIMTQQISAGAGIVFKGTGFYTTDYKHPSEHRASAHKMAKGLHSGNERVAEDLIGDAKKVKAESQKQQKTTKNTKNLPVKRRAS